METNEVEISLGRMYWAKVATYPWWPCMVYNSPNADGYVKKLKTLTKYHVQFFGPSVERAWVANGNLIPYKSNFELKLQLEKLCAEYPVLSPKYEFKVNISQKNRWEESCKEAEAAYSLSPEERIKRFGRIASPTKTTFVPDLEALLLKNVDRIPLTIAEEAESFEAFSKAEKVSRLQLNSYLDTGELDTLLRLQWSSFDFATQRSYLSNKLAIFGLQSMVDVGKKIKERSSGRKSNALVSAASLARKSLGSKPEAAIAQMPEEGLKLDAETLRLIASPGPYRFQPVCCVCKETSNDRYLLKCNDICGRYWHSNCLPDLSPYNKEVESSAKFVCKDCQHKDYLCVVCGEAKGNDAATEMHCCQMRDCGKWYHRHCVESQPGAILKDGIVRCPSHVCATCYLEDPKTPPCTVGQNMIQCFSCPKVFHTGDLCTPAGSRELSLSHIICPAHLTTTKRIPPASFCLSCRNGGSNRVNCESCPISYHRTCLDEMQSQRMIIKQDMLKCNNCSCGVQPRYAQVVWVKVHSCRWWPCEIIHSRNAPLNIYSLKHVDGEFVIHFIGTDEYGWVHRCQTFPFEYALGSPLAADVVNALAPLDKAFNRALLLAPLVHKLYVSYLFKRGLNLVSMETKTLTDEQLIPLSTLEAAVAVGILSQSETEAKALDGAMAKFQSISSNVYASSEEEALVKQPLPATLCDCARILRRQQGRRRHKHNEDEMVAQWRCSIDISCHNVLKGFECNPDICSVMSVNPSGDCGNRNFYHPPPVSLLLTTNRGYGLKVMQPVVKNTLVIEYIGEVIKTAEGNRRLFEGIAACNAAASTAQNTEQLPSTHLLRFTRNLVIDASRVGNEARFTNHSCEPNATVRVHNVSGILRLGIFAKRDLEEQEEVTIDYRKAQLLDCYFMNSTNVCVCGSELCDGFVKLPSKFPTSEKKRTSGSATSMSLAKPQALGSKNSLRGSRFSEVMRKPAVIGRPPRRSLGVRSMPPPSELPSRKMATKKPSHSKIASETHKAVATPHSSQPLDEEFCFRCGDGGEMVACNRDSCSRVYHIGCLGLIAPPTGNWHCPWHFCDVCGEAAILMCSHCPNSYCLDHSLTEAGNELIRVHDSDADRWHHTLKLLGKIVTNSVEMAEMIIALVCCCRWTCHVHEQAKLHPPDLVTVPSGGETANENRESHLLPENVVGCVGGLDEEHTASVDSIDGGNKGGNGSVYKELKPEDMDETGGGAVQDKHFDMDISACQNDGEEYTASQTNEGAGRIPPLEL